MRNKLIKTIALTLALSSLGAVGASASGQARWKLINNNWYYYDSNGQMKTGWIYDKGNWYYCYYNGQMAKNTTIDGYYLNSNGAWTLNRQATSDNAIVQSDLKGNGSIRYDINSTENDYKAQEILNANTNSVVLNSEYESMLFTACEDLAQGKNTIANLKSNCIGKVVGSKYRITNIVYLSKVFESSKELVLDYNPVNDKVNKIKESELAAYTPKSTYKYDKYLVFTGDSFTNDWEAMRVVIELEAL